MDVDPEVICIGHATLDAIVVVPRLPHRDERVPADGGALGGGGPAATAAVTLARLGVPVAFAGRVGDDVTGHWIRDGLADEGVDVRYLATAPGASPLTVVLVGPAGRRSLLPTTGTMAGPSLEALAGEPAFLDRCRAARWLHVDHIGIRAVPALRAAGVTTPVSYDGGNHVADLRLADVTLYAPTDAALAERYPGRTIADALIAALDEGPAIVVATRGSHGAIAAERLDDDIRIERVPAPSGGPIVSTLGAGDVFHGALLAGLVEGRSLEEALHWATTSATAACGALDGRSAIPDRARLDALLGGAGVVADAVAG
jgi:sugar/nucleoside kinase (ribokinase family)